MRAITTKDAEFIAKISRLARFESIPNYPDLHTVEEDLAFYSKEISTSSGLAELDEGDTIIGFILWRGDFINHLYVSKDHQRMGIGLSLLIKAIALIDAPCVNLWTFQANAKSVPFYKRAGFIITKATDGENEEKLPDYLFTYCR